MKRYLILLILAVNVQVVFGQTTEEWTEQDKTQIEYLLQQIAAQKVYLDYLEKGYGIAQTGLRTIKDIKKGDFNLHGDYFNSLKEVNPEIKSLAKVGDIIFLQLQIIKETKTTIQKVRQSGQFTDKEITYLKNVFDHLLEDCVRKIEELVTVITSGELEMKDDERIKRIDMLYDDMQDKFGFCNSFSKQASVLVIQRKGDQYEVKRSKKLLGLD
jgi:hypothetical protein